MLCPHCHHDISDDSRYCRFCGAAQTAGAAAPSEVAVRPGVRRLTRSRTQRSLAGVCGGIAEYFGVDVVVVRLVWAILSIVPGGIIGGVLVYLIAWLIMPEAEAVAPARPSRLRRSAANRQIAGVCGGLAEFLRVDATALRLLWAVLTILPGAILGGVLAYLIAWLIMPPALEQGGAEIAASSAGAPTGVTGGGSTPGTER
jgi:phage shock protein PspC (stress-responsive transcriptional regulator)